MRYLGGKCRIAKEIISCMDIKEWYVEPFVGGCNVIDKIKGKRIGADNNMYLIEMWKALQDGWEPPLFITEDKYNEVKNNIDEYPPHLVAYIAFNSFGGKWFAGYPRTARRNHWFEYNAVVMKQVSKMQDVEFIHSHYNNLDIPKNSTVYCDPPYEGTTKYKDSFNHFRFWDFARDLQSKDCKVYVSSYRAPSDFECIWSGSKQNSLNDKIAIERLYKCVIN